MASFPRYPLLNTGARIPTLGYGIFLASSEQMKEALGFALDVGYRHIDTAVSYQNETGIGDVLSEFVQTGKVRREDVFVTTKVPPVFLAPEDVQPCVVGALERLKVKYVDMLLIHSPWGLRNKKDGNLKPTDKEGNLLLAHHDLNKTWKELEVMVKKGLAKGIGLSNFNDLQIKMVLKNSKIKPGNLQLECHAYLQQDNLRNVCAANNIVVTGYAPFGSPARPPDRKNPTDPDLLADATIESIAERINRTPGQILLRYIMQIGVIPLPKSTNFQRIRENYDAQFFTLSDDDMSRIAGFNRDYKYFKFLWAHQHPEYDEGADF